MGNFIIGLIIGMILGTFIAGLLLVFLKMAEMND